MDSGWDSWPGWEPDVDDSVACISVEARAAPLLFLFRAPTNSGFFVVSGSA